MFEMAARVGKDMKSAGMPDPHSGGEGAEAQVIETQVIADPRISCLQDLETVVQLKAIDLIGLDSTPWSSGSLQDGERDIIAVECPGA